MQADLMRGVREIVPGFIYAVGGFIPADAPASWLPRHATGWMPVQCGVVRDGDTAIVIDTGLAIHGDAIRDGLAALLAQASVKAVLLTRREPDTMLNLPWITQQHHPETVRCTGPIDPFDFVERMEAAATTSQVHAMVGTRVNFIAAGDEIAVNGLTIEVVRPGLRVLSTDWFFEKSTGTLFTSDLWAFATSREQAFGTMPDVLSQLTVENVLDHLSAKFDWLTGIDTEPVRQSIAEVFATRKVERLCTNYGYEIQGRYAIDTLLNATDAALVAMAARPLLRPIDAFRSSFLQPG